MSTITPLKQCVDSMNEAMRLRCLVDKTTDVKEKRELEKQCVSLLISVQDIIDQHGISTSAIAPLLRKV